MREVNGVHWSNGPQWNNAQDAAEAEVRLDEALSYAATLLMWREAIK